MTSVGKDLVWESDGWLTSVRKGYLIGSCDFSEDTGLPNLEGMWLIFK